MTATISEAELMQRTGTLAILNVGAGDTKLSFDPKNPVECRRAATIVQDMLRRGYALLVQVGTNKGEPIYQRARAFDPKTCEYLIAGGPDETIDIGSDTEPMQPKAPERRGRPSLRVPASRTRAVAVARTAGG